MGNRSSPPARSITMPHTSDRTPNRRVLAIWCARLAIDRWRQAEGADAAADTPVALICETAHGPRITATNRAAEIAGVRTGTMLADARALCPALDVRPADPAGDLAFLERLAVWAQRWGPWSALDPPDGVIVDITGAAHLFGGEPRLLADASRVFERRGLTVRLAIAPTAGSAWALAHFAASSGHKGGAILPQDGYIAACLGQLPVAALRLDDDVLTVLRRLGLKRLGDLDDIGRDALSRRFRNRRSAMANPLMRRDQMIGLVPEPMLPVIGKSPAMVQLRLMEPIRHLPLLETVLADLAAAMMRELEGRGEGARRLEFACWRVDGEVAVRTLELAAATRDGAHICRLFAERIATIDAGLGIEMARLVVRWAEPLDLAQGDLEASAQQHGTSLAACVDRLAARLGPQAVRRPVPHASHVPERAQRWQAPLDSLPAAQESFAFHARPLKLLDKAELISVLYATPDGLPQRFRWRGGLHDVARAEGPERIAPEWWREKGAARLRDYYRIEDGEGRRFWIYRLGLAGDGRGGAPEWFLQGIFG